MAFPTTPTAAANTLLSSTTTTASTTHTFPSLTTLAPAAGDLIIAICVTYGGATSPQFSSWGASLTEILDDPAASGLGALGVAYKVASGSESGTFTVTSADAARSVQFLMRIPTGTWHGTTIPELLAAARATGAAADPGSFDPANWAAEDTLWISVGGHTETTTAGSPPTLDASPTNYSGDLIVARAGDAIGHITAGVSFRELNAASEDVGTWSGSNLNRGNGVATVIAIRPKFFYTKANAAGTGVGTDFTGGGASQKISTYTKAGLATSMRVVRSTTKVVSDLWSMAGAWFFDIELNNPRREEILDWAAQNNFGWVVLQCFNDADGSGPLLFQSYIGAWRDAIRARGMKFGLWGVLNTDPANDAIRADAQIDLWGADFFIADAEAHYKTDTGGVRGRAATFCTDFRALQPTIRSALSTYGAITNEEGILGDVTDANAGVMDFKAWYDAGFHVLPQAYASNTIYEPDKCVRHFRRCRWPHNRIHPTVGIYDGGATVRGDDYRTFLAAQNNATYEHLVRQDSPRAFWKLQDASGNPVDMSPNGLNFTSTTGTIAYRDPGPLGGSWAIGLNGGEYLDRSSAASTVTDNFTMEMWVKIEAVTQNDQSLFHNGVGSTNGWGIAVSTNGTFRYLAGNVAYGANSQQALTNAWHHVVVVRDGGTWRYYLNGVLDTGNAGGDAPITPSGGVRIGAGSLQPQIAFVAIYETVLSPATIAEHYDARANAPVCSQDTAYGFSLFLGEPLGAFGEILEQDYIDLGLATTVDDAATYDATAHWNVGVAGFTGGGVAAGGQTYQKKNNAGTGVGADFVGSGARNAVLAKTGTAFTGKRTIFPIAVGTDDGAAYGSGTYPPDFSDTDVGSVNFIVQRNTQYVNVGLLRFDTSSLAGLKIAAAHLSTQITVDSSTDDRSFVMEWYDWGASIGGEDYTVTASNDAHVGTLLDDITSLVDLNTGYTSFSLRNLENIDTSGYTHLRLHVDGGAPTGQNNLTLNAYENGTPSRLVVDTKGMVGGGGDATTYVESGTGVSAFVGGGTDVAECVESGRARIGRSQDLVWTQRDNPFYQYGSINVHDVARSDNADLWVAVGQVAKLATSSDGVSWAEQTSSFTVTDINAVARSESDGLWVAVGDAAKLATSSDGTAWTQRTSSFSSTSIRDVARSEKEDLWVAVGYSGKLATSSNGTAWTQQTSSFTFTDINAVARSDSEDLWVAAGGTGKLATSSDGVSWAQQTSSFGTSSIMDVARSENQDLWVAVGASGKIATSSDGSSWAQQTSPFGTSTINAVARSERENLWVAVGAGGKIATSSDGATWTLQENSFSGNDVYAVARSDADDVWIAGGPAIGFGVYGLATGIVNGLVASGSDAITWAKAGTAVSAFTGGGVAEKTAGVKTGAGVSEFVGSGADVAECVESGASASAFVGAGADESTRVETGTAIPGTAVSNLLGEGDFETGLGLWIPNASATLSTSTEQAHLGAQSMKVVTPGNVGEEGAAYNGISGIVAGTKYVYSFWLYTASAQKLRALVYNNAWGDGGGWLDFTSVAGWQRVVVPFTATDSGTYKFYVVTEWNVAHAYTYYVDDAQVLYANYGFIGSGVAERNSVKAGTAVSAFTASGADAATFAESGTALMSYLRSPQLRSSNSGALGNPPVPSGVQVGDLLVVGATSADQNNITANGYAHAPSSPLDSASGDTSVLYRIATGSDTCALSNGGARSWMAAFTKGTFDAADPFGGSAQDLPGGSGVTGTLPGITTERERSLILYVHVNARDGTNSTTFWGPWTTPSGETFTEFADFISSSGTGTGLAAGYFIRAAAGAMGAGSVTMAANGVNGGYTLEIRGAETGLGASGSDATTYVESGTAISGFVASGDAYDEQANAGSAISSLVASALDAVEHVESGAATSLFVASGPSEYTEGGGTEYPKIGEALSDFVASGTRQKESARTGSGISGFVASGNDATTYAETGAGTVGGITTTGLSAPTVRGAGNVAKGAGVLSPTLHPNTVAGDLLIMAVSHEPNTTTISVSGWTTEIDLDNASAACTASLLWRIATGTGDAPTLPSVNPGVARVLTIAKDTFEASDPIATWAVRTDSSVDFTREFPGLTLAVDDTLIILASASARDAVEGFPAWASWTAPNGETVTEWCDEHTNDNTGAGLGAAYFVRTSTGAMGTSSANTSGGGSMVDTTYTAAISPAFIYSGMTASGDGAITYVETGTAASAFAASGPSAETQESAGTGESIFTASAAKATESSRTGSATSVFTASGADAVASAETGAGIAPFVGAGDATSTLNRTGAGVSPLVGSGADAVTSSETGSGVIQAFIASGTSDEALIRLGSGVSAFAASGDVTVTISDTGSGVSPFVASGADAITFTETGSATSAFAASGADAGTFAESGSASSVLVASGDATITFSETGAGVTDLIASGSRARDITRAGAAVSQFASSGARAIDHLRAGTAESSFTASGVDAITSAETGLGITEFTVAGIVSAQGDKRGSGVSAFTASGADAHTASETGAGVAPLTTTGADEHTAVESGAGVSPFAASAPSVDEQSNTGAAVSAFSAEGARAAEHLRSGSATITLVGSGSDATEHAESGSGVAPFTASGSSASQFGTTYEKVGTAAAGFAAAGDATVEFSETGSAVAPLAASGTRARESSRTGSGTAPFVASGNDAGTFADSGSATAPFSGEADGRHVSAEAGAATAPFSASGSREKTSSQAGTGVLVAAPSGSDAVTFVESGTAISVLTISGTDAPSYAESGSATSAHTGDADARWEITDTGAGVLGATGSGTGNRQGEPTGTGVSPFTGSAHGEWITSESAEARAPFVGSASDSWTAVESGAGVSPHTALAGRAVEHIRSGVAAAVFSASAGGEWLVNRSGVGVIDASPSGSSAWDVSRSGAAVAPFTASGPRAREGLRTGSGIAPFVGAGVFVAERPRAGAALAPFTVAGAPIIDRVRTGSGVLVASGYGGDVAELARENISVAPFTVRGGGLLFIEKTGTAIIGLSGSGGKLVFTGDFYSPPAATITVRPAARAAITAHTVAAIELRPEARASIREVTP